jgi:hypothetical protein
MPREKPQSWTLFADFNRSSGIKLNDSGGLRTSMEFLRENKLHLQKEPHFPDKKDSSIC